MKKMVIMLIVFFVVCGVVPGVALDEGDQITGTVGTQVELGIGGPGEPAVPKQCTTYYNEDSTTVPACDCLNAATWMLNNTLAFQQYQCSQHPEGLVTLLDTGLIEPPSCPPLWNCESLPPVYVWIFVESRCCWPQYPADQ